MNNDSMKDEVSPNFGTVIADGAYVNFARGNIRLLFYRDTSFPIHKEGTFSFGDKQREILHEVRISYDQAEDLAYHLFHGTFLYDKYGRAIDPKQYLLVPPSIDQQPKQKPNDDDTNSTPYIIKVMDQLAAILFPMSDQAQKKAFGIIKKFLTDNKAVFDTIAKEFPKEEVRKNL